MTGTLVQETVWGQGPPINMNIHEKNTKPEMEIVINTAHIHVIKAEVSGCSVRVLFWLLIFLIAKLASTMPHPLVTLTTPMYCSLSQYTGRVLVLSVILIS